MENTVKNSKIFYGWWILLACIIVMALGYAPIVSLASLFIKPITEDLGFTRSAYTLSTAIISLMCMFMASITGKLMSTKHMHLIHVICVAGLSIFYGLYSLATSIFHFYVVSFFIGLFTYGATKMPVSILISNWFYEKRGLALSLSMAGTSIGGTLLSPIVVKLITNYGWRQTYVYLAIVMFLIMVPATIFIVRQFPSCKGLQSYGYDRHQDNTNKNTIKNEWNISLKEAKKLPVFWTFTFGVTLILLTGCILGHIPAYLEDSGYNPSLTASIVSTYLFIAIWGKVVLGHVFDKLGSKAGVLLGNICFIISIVCLLFIEFKPMLYLMTFFFGIGTCIGTVTTPVLTSRIFGTKHYPEIYGFVASCTCIGSIIGTPAIASIFDLTGSYKMAWIILIILSIIMTLALVYSINEGHKYRLKDVSQQTIK